MKRLLVQILCVAEVLLCAADSPPLSEDTLKSEAFIKHWDVSDRYCLQPCWITVCFIGVCRAVCSGGAACWWGNKASITRGEAGEGNDGEKRGEAQTSYGRPETQQWQEKGINPVSVMAIRCTASANLYAVIIPDVRSPQSKHHKVKLCLNLYGLNTITFLRTWQL